MIVEVKIHQIEIPQGFLPRIITGTIQEKVEEYKQMIEEGVIFDPVKVWRRSDGRIWLIDGTHRLQAYKLLGMETVRAELVECENELDYRMKAIRENLKHGIPLLPQEKKLLAKLLYQSGASKEEIVKLFGISERTFYTWVNVKEEKIELMKKAKELYESGKTQEEIAQELGIPRRTIADWLKSLVEDTHILADFAKNAKIAKTLVNDAQVLIVIP